MATIAEKKAARAKHDIVVKRYTISEKENPATKVVFDGEFYFDTYQEEKTFRDDLRREYKKFLKNPLVQPDFFIGQ